MTEEQFLYLVSRLFGVEQNRHLEKKVWFRFIRVAQGLAIFCVVLITALTLYLLFDAKSLSTATLVCKDGTTWNAIDEKNSYGSYKGEIDMYEMCGLCNYRLPDNQYRKCDVGSQSNLLFDSYDVNRTYTKDHSFLGIIGWSSLVLIAGLIIVKLIAKLIVYILGGGNKEE
jgi:hypothetical protein